MYKMCLPHANESTRVHARTHTMYNYSVAVHHMYVCSYVQAHRSCCHGNVRLNDDSKSQRSIPIASRVIINPVDVRSGKSAHDDKSHTRTLQAEA